MCFPFMTVSSVFHLQPHSPPHLDIRGSSKSFCLRSLGPATSPSGGSREISPNSVFWLKEFFFLDAAAVAGRHWL